ncbi:hypothetical protein [Sporosarcina sp. G11-34]|uniref:hypothetical protein n=1 Tax=Sporosarcina sp. G11-34 TaxID=2849605 RepID=UPI0022A9AF95|nr:hypothetical protein [Sporosarcina sp. G11-34]MCZ2257336.1 hypothetical protein [Sporosarcina sp. G11-34]
MADENNAPLPIGDELIALYEKAVEEGYGGEDMSSVYLMMKDKSESKLIKQ